MLGVVRTLSLYEPLPQGIIGVFFKVSNSLMTGGDCSYDCLVQSYFGVKINPIARRCILCIV